jgi:hypothetical protein
LGLVRASNKEIAQAVEDCADLEFYGELFCYYDAKTGKYRSYDLGGSQKHFFGFIRAKSGKIRYKIWKKKRFLQPKEAKLLPEATMNCPKNSNPSEPEIF